MTTEAQQTTRRTMVSVLVGATAAGLVAGLTTAVLGLVLDGPPAAYGALVGTVLTVVVFATGSFVVNFVAGLMPSAALLVALLTYTLQVVMMGAGFLAISGSGLLDGTLDRDWLAAAVIVGTLIWLLAQIVLTTRLRIPVYDLPDPARAGER